MEKKNHQYPITNIQYRKKIGHYPLTILVLKIGYWLFIIGYLFNSDISI
jgi:hypothetical protein